MNKSFLLFCFFPILLNAQNWNPINLQEKYNYQIDTADYIGNTIWIDSIDVINGDSVFYLNRIVIDCPECDSMSGIPNSGKVKIAKQNQFLQKSITKKQDGYYCFKGGINFCLKTNALESESWLFDTLQNIQATIIGISEQEVFGNLDSIKTILLSTNDTIVFSKNHGILKFQITGISYSLKGIEGRDVGELVPDFWDIYNFDVGDVFQYEGFYGDGSGDSGPTSTNWVSKIEILSKEATDSSMVYIVKSVVTYWMNPSYGEPYVTSSGTSEYNLIFEDSLKHYSNEFNRALVVEQEDIELCGSNPIGRIYNYMRILKDPVDQRITKSMGHFQDYPFCSTQQSYMFISEALDTMEHEVCAASFYYKFKEGLGTVCFSWWRFEQGGYEELVGYVKGLDTLGNISADEEILVSTNNLNANDWQLTIKPNPSNGKFGFSFNSNRELSLELYNMNGQIIYKKKIISGLNYSEIDIQNQPAGIYFLKVSDGKKNQTFKLIKQ